MSFLLLHLSDIHVTDLSTLKPPESVAACLREIASPIEDVAIVVSGDITFSGQLHEYDLATQFFTILAERVKEQTNCDPKLIIVPGNHDCAFPDDTSVRKLVLERIRDQHGVCDSPEMLRQCLGVQENFFQWAVSKADVPELDIQERICWTVEHSLRTGQKVVFLCLNTAWLSTLHELQGNLFFPLDRIPEITFADMVVSMFHHPYNWLDAVNARALRHVLEESSDIIITGHEHEVEIYTKSVKAGPDVEYIEGDVYHDSSDESRSGFNIILIDLAKDRYQLRSYTWEGARFSLVDGASTEWLSFVQNAKRISRPSEISDEMDKFLRDPGAQLTHRAKDIELEDIFITPNLRRFVRFSSNEGLKHEVVESDYAINRIFSDQYVYFGGDGQCGKTALARMLFFHAFRRGLVPVFIKGDQLTHVDPEHLQRTIHSQYLKQYIHPDIGKYAQQPKENKVIIIDDFFDSSLNREAKAKVCEGLKQNYGYLFVFGNDLTHIEEILIDLKKGAFVPDFVHYDIMEFGYLLRERLIEKWLSFGLEHSINKEDLAYQVDQVERMVNTVVGKNLVPAYPIFVLVMLQQLEAGQPLSMTTGTYGYFYEVLITGVLHKTSTSVHDVDTKYTYLAELAWYMFSSQEQELHQDELDEFSAAHWNKYRLTGSKDELIRGLIQSRLLVDHRSMYSFHYKYLYYYFVARYMQKNLSESDVSEALSTFVKNLHREDCANVIIFLAYLSHDRNLINSVLKAAREIYPDTDACDLKDHVSFINRLQATVPQIFLPDGDPAERRDQALRRLDMEDERGRVSDQPDNSSQMLNDESDKRDIDEMLSFNRASKSMQIMGQILRNFSGSLTGDLKQELVMECFAVGLRSLNAFFGLLEKHLDGTIAYFAEFLGKNIDDMSQEQRIKTAKEIIFFLTEALCFDTVKRISLAVGSERLMPTYDDVQRVYNNVATAFVQTAIRMDNSQNFPEKIVRELKKTVDKNIFGETLLRMLVANHFYLFLRPYNLRQRVCQNLGIKQSKEMLIGSAQRKRRK